MYNLTPDQKTLLRTLVASVKAKQIPEEFVFTWGDNGGFLHYPGAKAMLPIPGVTAGALEALAESKLIHIRTQVAGPFQLKNCTLLGKAYEAVDSDFNAPDTSFVRHLTPLSDITTLDGELKRRCLPILGAGAADPQLWDSASRTAGVILEERLRDVGTVADPHAIGRDLVNKVFGKNGTLAAKFALDSEREGHRDLYAGIVGVFRNASAHRLVDPSPQDGGVFIVFVDLLLKKLEDLR